MRNLIYKYYTIFNFFNCFLLLLLKKPDKFVSNKGLYNYSLGFLL